MGGRNRVKTQAATIEVTSSLEIIPASEAASALLYRGDFGIRPFRNGIGVAIAIRDRRHEVGPTQEELAGAAGVERSNIGKIECGEDKFSTLNLIRIAEAPDCKAGDILFAAEI